MMTLKNLCKLVISVIHLKCYSIISIQHGQISAILYAEAERTLLCEDTSRYYGSYIANVMTVNFLLYCSDEDDDNVIQPQQDPEDIAELEEELGTNAECMKNVDYMHKSESKC